MLAGDLLNALDPAAFMRGLGVTPDPWQEKALRSDSRRAIWNCSRQCGKSTIASLLALHRALYFPASLVLLVSPSLRQSSELFKKVAWWIGRMPHKPDLAEDNKLSCTLANGSRIVSLPSSDATIRGFSGVSLIIEDEASRVDDSLYYALRPMLATTNGRLILMSTPWGRRGHFFEEWQSDRDWVRIEARAWDCPRISKSFLENERRSLGPRWFAQEYECLFADTIDQVFDYETVMRSISADIQPLPIEVNHVFRRS